MGTRSNLFVDFWLHIGKKKLTHDWGVDGDHGILGRVDAVSMYNAIVATEPVIGVLPGAGPTAVDHNIVLWAGVPKRRESFGIDINYNWEILLADLKISLE